MPFELKPVVHRPNAVSYGRNDYDDTHWAAYIPRAVGYPDTAGHVKPGIADAAEWIWTADSEVHNDVYCRGRLKTEDLIGGAATGPVGCHTLDCANRPANCAATVDCTGWCVACSLFMSAAACANELCMFSLCPFLGVASSELQLGVLRKCTADCTRCKAEVANATNIVLAGCSLDGVEQIVGTNACPGLHKG